MWRMVRAFIIFLVFMLAVVVNNIDFLGKSGKPFPWEFLVLMIALGIVFSVIPVVVEGLFERLLAKKILSSGTLTLDTSGIEFKLWFFSKKFLYDELGKIEIVNNGNIRGWRKVWFNTNNLEGIRLIPKKRYLWEAQDRFFFLNDIQSFLNDLKGVMPYELTKRILVTTK